MNDQLPMSRREFTALSLAAGIAAAAGARAADSREVSDSDVQVKTKRFSNAGLVATIDVYEGCLHGWCIKDMPLADGKPIYNETQAERAWNELVALFKRAAV